jgi:hypothetical protein
MNSIQKENYMTLINELTGYLNNLFKPSNAYILYSYRFRKLFHIHNLFELKAPKEKDNTSLNGSQKSDDNSNKSMLESLLS